MANQLIAGRLTIVVRGRVQEADVGGCICNEALSVSHREIGTKLTHTSKDLRRANMITGRANSSSKTVVVHYDLNRILYVPVKMFMKNKNPYLWHKIGSIVTLNAICMGLL